MRFGFKHANDLNLGSEKDFLIREADEAFHANDNARCVELIERIYDLLDETLASSRRDGRPAGWNEYKLLHS